LLAADIKQYDIAEVGAIGQLAQGVGGPTIVRPTSQLRQNGEFIVALPDEAHISHDRLAAHPRATRSSRSITVPAGSGPAAGQPHDLAVMNGIEDERSSFDALRGRSRSWAMGIPSCDPSRPPSPAVWALRRALPTRARPVYLNRQMAHLRGPGYRAE